MHKIEQRLYITDNTKVTLNARLHFLDMRVISKVVDEMERANQISVPCWFYTCNNDICHPEVQRALLLIDVKED